jgi:hypothetical protein
MCLVIDSNVVHKVYPDPHPDFQPIHDRIASGKAKLTYGGRLTIEYSRMTEFRRLLRLLDQSGHARQLPDAEVEAATRSFSESGLLRSNDPHVLAVAFIGNVRLLCSEDEDLGEDFRDPNILPKPRGNVYKRASHANLLIKHCGR